MSAVRSGGVPGEDEVHAVRTEECRKDESAHGWRLRSTEECVADGLHLHERDSFTGLTYCRFCGEVAP